MASITDRAVPAGTEVTPSDGPTRTTLAEPSSWERRPVLASTLRGLIALTPTAGSFLVTFVIARYLPASVIGLHTVFWWIGLVAAGSATLMLLDRAARQLLPLVALLRLSLIFPDQAPSRFSMAMRTGTTRQLQRRVEAVKDAGLDLAGEDADLVGVGAEQRQAEHLLELVAALSRHDRLTRGHCERVRAYTDLLAEELHLPKADANRLRWAALAHDVGKIYVPAEILNSRDVPAAAHWEQIKSHTWRGAELVEPLRPWLGEWLDVVGQHHEWWNGQGYPNQMAGKDIHVGARIVAVADAFDVMTSRRSYKKPMSATLARAEIASMSGSQFDPEVARALMNLSIGRLRFAVGPLTWLLNVPSATSTALTPIAAPAVTTVTAAATTMVAGFAGVWGAPPPSLALVDIDPDRPAVVSPSAGGATEGLDESAPGAGPRPTATGEQVDQAAVSTSVPRADITPSTTVLTSTTGPSTTGPSTTGPSTTEPSTTGPSTAEAQPVSTTAPQARPTTTAAPPTTVTPTTAPNPTITVPTTPQPTIVVPTTAPGIELALGLTAAQTMEDTATVFSVQVLSPDQPSTAEVLTPPSLGTLSITSLPAGARSNSNLTIMPVASRLPALAASSADIEAPELPGVWFEVRFAPLLDAVGDDTFVVEFCDGAGRCQSASFDVSILPVPDAPRIVRPTGPIEFTIGVPHSVTIVASDPDGDQMRFGADGLPAGLTIDPESGVISGELLPEALDDSGASGTRQVVVTVTDDASPPLSSTVAFDLTMLPPDPPDGGVGLTISAARHHSSPGEFLIDEFVAITNTTDHAIDLADVELRDFAVGASRDSAIKFGHEADTSFVHRFGAVDADGRASVLAPGQRAIVWISDPNGTQFELGGEIFHTEAFTPDASGALRYVIAGGNWNRLDLDYDDLWLHDADGALLDFVRWRRCVEDDGPTPSWWSVPFATERRWATAGSGAVLSFDHER